MDKKRKPQVEGNSFRLTLRFSVGKRGNEFSFVHLFWGGGERERRKTESRSGLLCVGVPFPAKLYRTATTTTFLDNDDDEYDSERSPWLRL